VTFWLKSNLFVLDLLDEGADSAPIGHGRTCIQKKQKHGKTCDILAQVEPPAGAPAASTGKTARLAARMHLDKAK